MKVLFFVFAISFSFLSYASDGVEASEKPQTGSATNMSFDELLIQGKYHFSDEVVVTVENDKVLDSLLGVRKNFKDRIEQSATR